AAWTAVARWGSGSVRGFLTIQYPIAHGFGHVLGRHILGAGDVGDGASHLQYPVIGAGRETELFHGPFQELLACRIRLAVLVHLARAHARVGPALARELPFPRGGDTQHHLVTGLTVRRRVGPQGFARDPRRLHVQVDAVQQGTRYLG